MRWALPLCAAAVGTGTAVGFGRPSLAVPGVVLCVVLVVAALTSTGLRAIGTAVVALCVASAGSAAFRSGAVADAVLPKLVRRDVEVCGTVRELGPRSVEVAAEVVSSGERRWETKEPVRIALRRPRSFGAGARVCAKGEVAGKAAQPPLLLARSIANRGRGSVVRATAGALRARFAESAARALPRRQAGLLLGMTDGDVALLDERTMEAFRTTGLAHLVAVSGSNVAAVLAGVMLLARALVHRSRWLRAAVALPPLVFFAFVTGLEASVLRAVVAAAVALVIAAEGRTTDGIRVVSVTFVALVLSSPELLFRPGFQLSFAATTGLIVWARPLADRLMRRLPPGRTSSALAICASTTVAAQAAAAPFLVWHFGRVPALGGLANFVVAPLAPVVMIGGSATLSVAAFVPGLDWAPVLMRLPLDAILWCGKTFASLPGASVEASIPAGVAIASGMGAIVAGSARVRRGAVALLVIAGAAAGGAGLADRGCADASITALDVEQGTAVLLRSGDTDVLVDGGPAAGGVVSALDDQGIRHLDAVFVSHPHADHTEGVVRVLERLDVDRVFAPVTIGWGKGAEVVAAARAARVPIVSVASGDTFQFGSAVQIEVISPEPGPEPAFAEDLVHGYSLVLRVTIGHATVLLPGDIGAAEEVTLLESDVRASVLVAPHHGSKDIDPRFDDAVRPKVTLVTVGPNRYGHPAPEALREYAAHGRVLRTDEDGDVSLCVVDTGLEVTSER